MNFSLMGQICFSFKWTFSFSIANFTVTCLSVSHSRRDISTFLNNLTMKTIYFMNAYDSIATVGESRLWWRADFQSGSRVLKKVF